MKRDREKEKGEKSDGGPRAKRRQVTPGVDRTREAVHARLSKLHTDLTAALDAAEVRRRDVRLDDDMSEARSLDRLAWVVAHLKDQRECVAVHLDITGRKVLVWANKPDGELASDTNLLIKAAGEDEYDGDSGKAVKAKLAKSKLDVRVGAPGKATRDKADRRLDKTFDFLAERSDSDNPLTASAPKPTVTVRDGSLHAEQAAADFLVGGGDAGGGDNPRFGISKLCCFLCWRGLAALRGSDTLDVAVTDTHLHVYGNWPLPDYLTNDDQMLRVFLAVDERLSTEADRLLDAAIRGQRKAVTDAIRSFDDASGVRNTDYISSDEESEFSSSDDEEIKSSSSSGDSGESSSSGGDSDSSSSDDDASMETDEPEVTSESDDSDADPSWGPGGR